MLPPNSVQLRNGDKMPLIGYGTFKVNGFPLIRELFACALSVGYRLFDTAISYDNEADIGLALSELMPKHNLKREDIFITSKIPPRLMGNPDGILEAVKTSLNNLRVRYLDLVLIHSPGPDHNPSLLASEVVQGNVKVREITWEALIQAKNQGLVRSIGVCNYALKHMIELMDNCHGVTPSVNQIEWNPYCHNNNLLDFCQSHNIFVQAFCSLGGTEYSTVLLSDENVEKVSAKLKKSPAQVVLAWALQQGVGVIPKSVSQVHIQENFNSRFAIPKRDFATLNSLVPRRFGLGPNRVP